MESLLQYVEESWERLTHSHKVQIASFGIATACAMGVAAYQWRRGNHLSTHNCSLNIVTVLPNGEWEMTFRTLYERPLVTVLGENRYAASIVARHARRVWKRSAVDSSPFLVLPRPEDHKSVMKCVVNQLSGEFSDGYCAQAMGLPVHKEWFVVGLTCEKEAYFLKTRSMVIREEVLNRIALISDKEWQPGRIIIEHPNHHRRLRTIRRMALEFTKTPENFAMVELAVQTNHRFDKPPEGF